MKLKLACIFQALYPILTTAYMGKRRHMKQFIFAVCVCFLLAGCRSIAAEQNFVDFEGNTYSTVTIGDQIWMAENLKTQYDVLGGKLSGVYAYNSDKKYVEEYGRLYTRDAAERACPDGWRLPSEEDWMILEKHIGGNSVKKLMSSEEGGFGALLGGYRFYGGGYADLGTWGQYWTSTLLRGDHYIVINLFPDKAGIEKSGYGENGAVSVRYIRISEDNAQISSSNGWNYLDQDPPGNIPSLFAEGIISTRGRSEYTLCFWESDERNGLFTRFGVGNNDLFVSFQTAENHWTEPANLGKKLGVDYSGLARLSPCGKYLFFHSRGDIYWVGIDVIEDLRQM